jgi:hypothetical protein
MNNRDTLLLLVGLLGTACSSTAALPGGAPADGSAGIADTAADATRDDRADTGQAGDVSGPDACAAVPGASPCGAVSSDPDECARASCPPAGCASLAAAWDTLAAGAHRICATDADCAIVSGGNGACETARGGERIDGTCAQVVNVAEFESSAMSRIRDDYAQLRCPWRRATADCGEWVARCSSGVCLAVQLHGCARSDAAPGHD